MNHTSYTEEQFVEYLESLIENEEGQEVLENKFYEKELDIWNQIDNSEEIKLSFDTTGYTWNIDIELRDDVVSAGFYNIDSNLYNISYVFFFRNCNDYSRVVAKPFSAKRIGVDENGYVLEKYFNREDNGRGIVENDKVVCGVYLRVYKVDKEETYLNNLKSLIVDDSQKKVIKDEYFEYGIEKWDNFSNGKLTKYVYPHFSAWKLQFNKKKGPICVRLDDYSLLEGHPPYTANIVLSLHNNDDTSCYCAKPLTKKATRFDKDNYTSKLKNFVSETELFNKNESGKSIVENNTTKVGFYVRSYENDKNKNDVDEEDPETETEYNIENEELQPLTSIVIHNGEMEKGDHIRTRSRNNSSIFNRIYTYIRYILIILIVIVYFYARESLFIYIDDLLNKNE